MTPLDPKLPADLDAEDRAEIERRQAEVARLSAAAAGLGAAVRAGRPHAPGALHEHPDVRAARLMSRFAEPRRRDRLHISRGGHPTWRRSSSK